MASISYTLNCFLMIVFSDLQCRTITASLPLSPQGILLDVTKNSSTLLHTIQIHQDIDRPPLNLLVDISYKSVFVECLSTFREATFNISKCGSQECEFAKVDFCSEECEPGIFRQWCVKDSCFSSYPYEDNLIGSTILLGWIAEAHLSFQSISYNLSSKNLVDFPRFVLTCSDLGFFPGDGIIDGVAALGRSQEALSSQLAKAFKFSRKFSLCLSSSTKSKGWISFGDARPPLNPKANLTKYFKYTPFITSQYGIGSDYRTGMPSSAYFLGVTSIKVSGKTVKGFNHGLLSINGSGIGGTTITSTKPYTILERSIYNVMTTLFLKELESSQTNNNVTRVASVEPFEFCFNSESIRTKTYLGPAVPPIDLILQNKNVSWRIYGANSMVQINKDIMCLGYVPRIDNEFKDFYWSIEIGAHQIEDNILEFNLDKSQLGFSSSLLAMKAKCNIDFDTEG
ncbi:protease [Lithospermum erythrorhizon]|uniref:Protease n=1 Tax=Lithospermum erythrorhizon TaxID=34254 RepID=A0AAV3Q658_LITER